MQTRFLAILVLAILFLAPRLLQAQQEGIRVADTNGDKKLDKAEFKAYVSAKLPDFDRFDELFKELDSDENGSIDSDEFARRMRAIQAVGQRPKPEAKRKSPTEFVDLYDARFAKRKPQVGATIDAGLSAFDGSGKPFQFEATRGQYTVIVFGCLT